MIKRAKLIELFNNELDKMGFGENIDISYGQLGFEAIVQNGKVEATVRYKATTKSWDFNKELASKT